MNVQFQPTNKQLTPPLRIVLNRQCNGNCSFCHHEGYMKDALMPIRTVSECATIAKKLSIPTISLTGGEPTLRQDLHDVIGAIQEIYNGDIGLTTNGYRLPELCKKIKKPLHTINLSISSFNKKVYKCYQNTNPFVAVDALQNFPAQKKNLNIVVIQENYQSISEIVAYCLERLLSVDLMFELKRYTSNDFLMQQCVISELLKIGQPEIKYGITPTLTITFSDKCTISIKHPLLSSLVEWPICQQCTIASSCFERICSIRVYPDGTVSPCLNGTVGFRTESLLTKIEKTYECLGSAELRTMSLSEFLANFY